MDTAPTAAPVNLAGNIVDSTTIFISWNAPPLSFQNGIIRMYSVRYTAMESGITYTVTTQNKSIDLTGLHPFYNYFISVAAYTVQTGPYSSSIMLKTPTAREYTHLKHTMLNVTYYLYCHIFIIFSSRRVARELYCHVKLTLRSCSDVGPSSV